MVPTSTIKVYACGHHEPVSHLTSRGLYEWATKDTPDLCSGCQVLLLQQRLNYFTNTTDKLGDFEAKQLLLQIIDAKLYTPPGSWINLLTRWALGAAQRLDGREAASQEVAKVLTALDNVQHGPLIMEFVQTARRNGHLCRVEHDQQAFFQARRASLWALHCEQQHKMYEMIDPALMCSQLSETADRHATGSEEQPNGTASFNETLDTVLQTRPWNPQVRALRARLQEALEQGDFNAKFDEAMTNAEETLEVLWALQGSIAARDLRAKGGILSCPSKS